MNNIIERNYQSIKARGLIDKNTAEYEFEDKLLEETREFIFERDKQKKYIEAVDVIFVMFNYLRHNNQDIEKLMNNKIEINEKRCVQ